MLYCRQCGVHVTGSPARCPLCQGTLTGEPGEDSYPALSAGEKPYRLTVRVAALITVAAAAACAAVAALITVAAAAACAAVNLSLPESGWWSVFVAAGLATTWLLLWVAVRKRSNPVKAILWQLGLVCTLALLWDLCTGFWGWSVNFVLPVFIPCMQLAVWITARALRLRAPDYLFYLALCILAGLLPLATLLLGALEVVYPSVICAGISVVFLAALLLFRGGELKDELARRTHW